MKLPATQLAPREEVEPRRNGESLDGEPPPFGSDESTNVMESGLLRTLTDKSARDGGPADANNVVTAPAAPPPLTAAAPTPTPPQTPAAVDDEAETRVRAPVVPALPSRRSRVFVVAGIVAVIVLAFDAWLLTHHRRQTRPPAIAAPAAPPTALPTYMVLPVGTPAPPDPPPSKIAVAEEEAPAVVPPAPAPHRHHHHRRHSTP